jgi:hypothetical protein
MCTVSHCREILPVGYEFLRCERHRVQNRHHSKLKRVRDKDAKAQALEGWFATLSTVASDSQVYEDVQSCEPSSGAEIFEEGESSATPVIEMLGIDEHKQLSGVNVNVVEPSVIVFGVPPAARGVRRTNHICSIKGCHNLLSPSMPWKMCDDCREYERTVRKIRALRESGVMVDPPPPRMPPRERKEKPPKEKKTKASQKGKTQEAEMEPLESSAEPEGDGDSSGTVVFMDPVLPNEDGSGQEVRLLDRVC